MLFHTEVEYNFYLQFVIYLPLLAGKKGGLMVGICFNSRRLLVKFPSPFPERSSLLPKQSWPSSSLCSPSTPAIHIQLEGWNQPQEKEVSRFRLVKEDLLNGNCSQLHNSCSGVLDPLHPVHPSAFTIQLGPQASLTSPLYQLNDLNGLLLTHVLGC